MALDPARNAERLGAVHVGQIPDTGGGAFGMARLAAVLSERLQPTPADSCHSNVRWILNRKVPMSRETEDRLIMLAEQLSTPERRISPMQLAAQLLEESLRKLPEKT
jgi:hypothetical protein